MFLFIPHNAEMCWNCFTIKTHELTRADSEEANKTLQMHESPIKHSLNIEENF